MWQARNSIGLGVCRPDTTECGWLLVAGRDAVEKPNGAVNRAKGAGLHVYCSRACFGLARRKHKTQAQKVAEKAVYDADYRRRNVQMLRAKKHAYHVRTYDPEAARIVRKKRMPHHVEYCRRPAYKLYKQDYDRKRRAAAYGPAAEAYTLLLDLNREIKGRMTNHEIRQANGTFGKRQARAREGREAPADKAIGNGHRPA